MKTSKKHFQQETV